MENKQGPYMNQKLFQFFVVKSLKNYTSIYTIVKSHVHILHLFSVSQRVTLPAFNLKKKIDRSSKKYLLTVMENIVQFSRRIENFIFDLFFNFFFNDNFLGFRLVSNFETSRMYLRSIT